MGKKLWTATENVHEETAHYEQYDRQCALAGDRLIESPAEMIEDADNSLAMVSEGTKTAFERLSIVQSISGSLDSKKVCSEAYMTSLENYRPVLEQIIGELGMRRSIPCTEDFVNLHRAQSAHLIATEGLGEFLKNTWKKIKEFFALFFKKISLYFKRMVKANLELENYEEYLGPMMAKLRAKGGKAMPTDLAAFESKLPSLLSDEGMQSMDAEYFMNYGVQKTEKLLGFMEMVGFKGVGRLNEADGLPMLASLIHTFVKKHNDLALYTLSDLTQDANIIKDAALGLLSAIFSHVVTDPKELPESVYNAISDGFTRTEMGEGFVLRSLMENNAGKNSLPKDANLFMAHGVTGAVYVEGYVSQNTYVRNMIAPPASFMNLQRLYDFYQNRLKKLDVRNADKTLDLTNDLITKVLMELTEDLAPMTQKLISMRRNVKSSSDVAELLIGAQQQGISVNQLATEILNKLFDEETLVAFSTDEDYADTWRSFCTTIPQDTGEYRRTFVNAYADKLDALFKRYGKSLLDFANAIEGKGGRMKRMTQDEIEQAKVVVQDLNRMLTNFFTRVQSILRFIMTNVYGVYTELRYEYVRYLYLSAQRYRAA